MRSPMGPLMRLLMRLPMGPRGLLWLRRAALLLAVVLLAACAAPQAAPPFPTRGPTTLPPTPTGTPPPTVDVPALYANAVQLHRDGDLEHALQVLGWVLEQQPGHAPALVQRAMIYAGQGDYEQARADLEAATEADPDDGATHALLGELLWRHFDLPRAALQALGRAVELDPSLGPATFATRWQAALLLDSARELAPLAREYVGRHPDDPLGLYYQGWAELSGHRAESAARLLAEGLHRYPDAPALVWYTLGIAYLEGRWFPEAAGALEVAQAKLQAGDQSLSLHTGTVLVDLTGNLGLAYLGAGRCPAAVSMLEFANSLSEDPHRFDTAIERAQVCSTPTPFPPTITPMRP